MDRLPTLTVWQRCHANFGPMWKHNILISDLHWHANIAKAAMPTKVQCNVQCNVQLMFEARQCQSFHQCTPHRPIEFTWKQTYIVSFPVLSMCTYPFRYHYDPFRYLFDPLRCLFGPFRCLFGPFRSLSVLFGVYSYPWNFVVRNERGIIMCFPWKRPSMTVNWLHGCIQVIQGIRNRQFEEMRELFFRSNNNNKFWVSLLSLMRWLSRRNVANILNSRRIYEFNDIL